MAIANPLAFVTVVNLDPVLPWLHPAPRSGAKR
jgi:hypothetical protein